MSAAYEEGNRLIDGLPLATRNRITPHLMVIAAEEGSDGISRGERITAAYFPIDAVFSVLVELSRGECYEVDAIGRTGFVGGELLFGIEDAARSVLCQVSGRVAQMPLEAFGTCLVQTPPFARAVHASLLLQWYRAQQTVACNAAHTLLQRCARWALLTRDAVGRDVFTLRSEYLSMMVGERTRATWEPMMALESIGALRYAEDAVTVVSPGKLREAACECYAAPVHYAQGLPMRSDVQADASEA